MAPDPEVERLREELREYEWLTGRMGYLLTRVANALKGEPDELLLHDWSDLPEVALRLQGQLAELRELRGIQ